MKFDNVAIILNVADVERTHDFYTRHLGIEFVRNEEEDGSLWLLAKVTPTTELLVFPGSPEPGNSPIIVFGLAEGGIDDVVRTLANNGVDIITPVSEAPGGWSADFADADGHLVSLYQDGRLPRHR